MTPKIKTIKIRLAFFSSSLHLPFPGTSKTTFQSPKLLESLNKSLKNSQTNPVNNPFINFEMNPIIKQYDEQELRKI